MCGKGTKIMSVVNFLLLWCVIKCYKMIMYHGEADYALGLADKSQSRIGQSVHADATLCQVCLSSMKKEYFKGVSVWYLHDIWSSVLKVQTIRPILSGKPENAVISVICLWIDRINSLASLFSQQSNRENPVSHSSWSECQFLCFDSYSLPTITKSGHHHSFYA